MAKLKEVIKRVPVPVLVDAVERTLSVAKAVNSTKTYKHKDTVDKVINGASTVLDVGLGIYRVLKR